MEAGSSARVASAFSHWTVSPAPQAHIFQVFPPVLFLSPCLLPYFYSFSLSTHSVLSSLCKKYPNIVFVNCPLLWQKHLQWLTEKERRLFSPTGFQGFQFTADWPHGLWPAERQSITVLSTLKRWASHHSSIEQKENGDRQLSVNLFVMCLITFLSSIRSIPKGPYISQ